MSLVWAGLIIVVVTALAITVMLACSQPGPGG